MMKGFSWALLVPLLAALALADLQRPSVGNTKALFRVNPFNTLDAMRGNKTGISPQCSAGEADRRPARKGGEVGPE